MGKSVVLYIGVFHITNAAPRTAPGKRDTRKTGMVTKLVIDSPAVEDPLDVYATF